MSSRGARRTLARVTLNQVPHEASPIECSSESLETARADLLLMHRCCRRGRSLNPHIAGAEVRSPRDAFSWSR